MSFKCFNPLAPARRALAAIVFIVAGPLCAAADTALADRMHRLTQDLRCLVCQNESLADSHAPLAMDLKREIRARMEQGESDAQIRDFLLQRYGDFVNYHPPFKASTLLLWVGPLLLLAAGGFVVWRTVRSRPADDSAARWDQGADIPERWHERHDTYDANGGGDA
jgi:cytochrome c-type biogenesis protein CcmH